MAEKGSGFSIFHPVIRIEHREFYEAILNEISSISPVCNQARSTAAEISKDSAEEELIIDLIKKVEDFSNELLSVTKNLFDQFYQTKEKFYESMLMIMAYNKINLMDRNLLERTCDVRWWSMESPFTRCVERYNQVSSEARDVDQTVMGLGEQLIGNKKAVEAIEGIRQFLKPTTWLKDKIDDLEHFHTHVEEIYKCLKEISKENLKTKIDVFLRDVKDCCNAAAFASSRLEDIVNSYTIYRDLIVTGADGNVIASANKDKRAEILGMQVADEPWYESAMALKDGNQYHAQDVCDTKLEEKPSLVYSTTLREGNSPRGKITGVMGVFFDFQSEAALILDEYMPRDSNDVIQDDCYSIFTNEKGVIICSSDEQTIPSGNYMHLPRWHRELGPGEKTCSYSVIEGRESALITAKTDGYLEYKGLGWSSHVIVPKSHIFEHENSGFKLKLDRDEMMESCLIPEINKKTYERIQEYKESIQLISLNGIVFASKLGKRGAALGPIFDRITKTGDYATNKMEELLIEMAEDEFAQNAEALETFSKQAIDLIDRNLFERAADIRWWATDTIFSKALEDHAPESCDAACERLKVINNSYNMYRNLVLCDPGGQVIATSRTESRGELKQLDLSNEEWFLAAMRTNSFGQFGVGDVSHSALERHKETSLIYSGGVRKQGAREGEAIGVLGLLFDWDSEARKVLESCLQKDQEGKRIKGTQAFYTNSKGKIIESTDGDLFKVGVDLKLPDEHSNLGSGLSFSGIFEYEGKRYLLGTSKTKGYREYKGLGWSAHVIRPIDY